MPETTKTSTGTTETKKFDSFALDDWWGEKGKLVSLQRINPIRFGYFADAARRLGHKIEGATVLDAGCGGGVLSESFAAAGAKVTGIDLSPVGIEVATRHAKVSELEIEYSVTSVEEHLKKNAEKYDIVVCAEVLEHVDDVEAFLDATLKMLKPGGLFFFGTLNKTLKSKLFAIFVAEDVLRMLPRGTHDYSRFVRPSVLVKILKKNNVLAEDIKGMSYSALSLDFKLSGDTSVNYLGVGVKE
ncbi:MAG: bifunctional 2-polyprenyl-6-hydroxyphenol methylase/3-demethylubiquinol 3-O-methyltransferase UbiG [Proteobacteria bacterium]|nr:bifunctional 2-polyprenyl-6-hydroxyphenol methylase/3-demethylubiquinol 3-O-methyltransferase UbiG [Pseudomonadota bacterium]